MNSLNSKLLLALVLASPALWAATPAKPASGATSGQSQAQQQTPPPPPPDSLVIALDTDEDHLISAAEIAAAPLSLLDLDLNDDGRLTPDELIITPPPPPAASSSGSATKPASGKTTSGSASAPKKPSPPPPPLMVALDTDKDGSLSAEEIAAAPTALATLDKNTDGQLTPKEFAPPPPKPAASGGAATKPAGTGGKTGASGA